MTLGALISLLVPNIPAEHEIRRGCGASGRRGPSDPDADPEPDPELEPSPA